MNYVEITKSNAARYEEYLGADLTENMSRFFFRGLAAEDEDGAYHGALVYELYDADSEADTKSRIRFLSTDDDEITEQLRQQYEEAVSTNQIVKSYYESDDDDLARVLSQYGFKNTRIESSTITLPIGELTKLPINRKVKLPKYVKVASDINVLQYRNYVKTLLIKGMKGSVEDLAYLSFNFFERDISSCTVSDDKLDGIFLARRTASGELHTQLLSAFGPDYIKNLGYMLVHSMDLTLEKYPPETPLVINRRNKDVAALVQKLLAGYKGTEVNYGERDE